MKRNRDIYRQRKYERGMALPITLFLGVLALVIVAIVLMFLLFGKKVDVVSERYTSLLEAARGGGHYIIKQLELGGDIDCYNSNDDTQRCKCYETQWDPTTQAVKCPAGFSVDRIDMGSYKTLSAPDGGEYNLEAILFYKKNTPDGLYYIYSFQIQATKSGTNEKAIIDIIFKAPSKSSFY